jgi:2-polyprenyl-6-methoxyphenol hydroxylase-like FAD-dependent oxidoreductase
MAATPKPIRVLISGGGIAGLTLAILLKEQGYEPLVVERDENVRGEGYMMDFFGTGWDVATRMGLVEELRAIRYPIGRMEFVDREGAPYITVPIERLRDALDDRYVYLRRSDLERILYERARSLDVTIRFATTVERLVESENEVVATFADGVHSRLRELVFGKEDAFAHYLGGYVAAIHMPHPGLDLDGALKLHEETDHLAAFYPLDADAADATFIFRYPDAGHIPAERRLPLLREKTAGPGWMSSRVLAALPASIPVYFDSLTQIRMPNWHRGRVALIGDACGCLTLLAGQGSHMAMADAYVLATELGRHPGDHVDAFRAYESLMKPATVKKQAEAERFAAIAMPSEKSRPWLRKLATRLMFSRLGLRLGMRVFGARSVLEGYPA